MGQLSLHVHCHDVVVHEVAVAYGEVTGPGFVHAQVLVEAHCVVVSIHVEFNAGGAAGNLLYALHNLVEKEKTQAGSLALWQDVKFFKMEKLGSVIELPFKTEGDIAFFTIEVEDMTKGGHLVQQTFL